MIITRTPFRVIFAGGGSDLPSFYCRHEEYVLSTSINKYVYVSIHPICNPSETIVKYSNGDLNIPYVDRTADGFRLGRWLARQKSAKKAPGRHSNCVMTPERIQKLERIGVVWDGDAGRSE